LLSEDQIAALQLEFQGWSTNAPPGVPPDKAATIAKTMLAALDCHRMWAAGNRALANRNYLLAVRTHLDTARLIDAYFLEFRGTADPNRLFHPNRPWQHQGRTVKASPAFLAHFRERYRA